MSSTEDDTFALARITVTADTSLEQLDRWLQGLDLPQPPPSERLRTRAHRAARWTRQRLQLGFTAPEVALARHRLDRQR